ncbi:MAG: hypothetical protein ACFB0B_21210 [Thermonemataceae bacterium]
MQQQLKDSLENHYQRITANIPQEKVAQEGDLYFSYTNPQQTLITLVYFAKNTSMRLCLQDLSNQEVRWFEIKIADQEQLGQFLEALAQQEQQVTLNNYFSFYAALSKVSNVSILAWEQWESNYK